MLKLILVTCSVFICSFAIAQDDTTAIKKNIRLCADSMATAFMTKDWKTFTRFTVPSLVEMLGGEDSFIVFTKEMLAEMPDSAIKEYTIRDVVQLVKTPGNWQAVVEQHLVFEADSMILNSTSYLVGISLDGGRAWSFLDPQGETGNARLLVPDLSPAIIIPKTKDDLRNKE
ncbi:MAG: hypothetical protein EPN92_03750 [Chitinophagaceae bacterium]|nr:MAG: hypothetical protein EPN92_03750 [Chitinophagaceae bacterium]